MTDEQKKESLLFEDIKIAYLDMAKINRKTNIISKPILKSSKCRALTEINNLDIKKLKILRKTQ